MNMKIDISRIQKDTLELMTELSKSDKEYCIPLIDTHGSISAYDVIEGLEHSVCAITPSLVSFMVAQFHNHPGETNVIISDQDMIISHRYNMPLIIGSKKEIKLFELKTKNTFTDDIIQLIEIQDEVIPKLDLGEYIDDDLREKFRNAHEKTLSNFDITLISTGI
jgi:hypothetical protein